MAALANLYRRFVASTRGLAAIEFAMILPMLLVLFLASFDAGNAIIAYMKVRSATFALAAITNQYNATNDPITTTVMSNIMSGTAAVLAPYPSAPAVTVVSQIKATSSSQAVVSWSYSPTSGYALTPGASYALPANFAQNTCGGTYPCYVIFAQVTYTYTPSFGYFITGPITLSDSLYATPRGSVCVQYNGVPATC